MIVTFMRFLEDGSDIVKTYDSIDEIVFSHECTNDDEKQVWDFEITLSRNGVLEHYEHDVDNGMFSSRCMYMYFDNDKHDFTNKEVFSLNINEFMSNYRSMLLKGSVVKNVVISTNEKEGIKALNIDIFA